MNEQQLDTILARLLAGESAESLAQEFPEAKPEILSYAKIMGSVVSLKQASPRESGLYAALQTVRTAPRMSGPTPSPFSFVRFTQYSFVYKSAFALPVVLVLLIASGAYFIPRGGSPTSVPTQETTLQTSTFSDSAASGPSQGASLKTASLAPMAEPTLPQDTTLSAIYGPELKYEVQAVKEDSMQAASTSDDTQETEGFTKAYDEASF